MAEEKSIGVEDIIVAELVECDPEPEPTLTSDVKPSEMPKDP